MKFIHCADLHLDSKMDRTLSKASERRNELLHNFHRMIEFARENEVRGILICGDLFDSNSIRVTTKKVLQSEIISNSDIAFFYVRGNHDENAVLFEKDKPSNFIVFDENFKSFDFDTFVISGVQITEDNCQSFYDEINLPEDRLNILMLHGDINSCEDKELYIDIKKLKDKNIDYLALGHIHQSSFGKIDKRGTFCYSGCLEGRGFDECDEKGFILLDVGTKISFEFVDFSMRKFRKLNLDISHMSSFEDYKKKFEKLVKNIDSKDCLRVILNGYKDEDCSTFGDILERLYYPNFYYFEVKDNSKIKFNLEKYLQEETSLKAEFLKLVFMDDTLSEEEKNKIATIGLQALKGDDILL